MPLTQEDFDALRPSETPVFHDTSSGFTLLWIVVPLIIMFVALLISMRKDTGGNKITEMYKFHEGYRRIWIVVSTVWILGAAYPFVIQPFHEEYTLAGDYWGMTTLGIFTLIFKDLDILLIPPLGLPLLLKLISETVKWIREGFMATGSYRNPSNPHPLIDEVDVKGNVETDGNIKSSEDDG